METKFSSDFSLIFAHFMAVLKFYLASIFSTYCKPFSGVVALDLKFIFLPSYRFSNVLGGKNRYLIYFKYFTFNFL
ncbi:MAG TPA: hypothetical protein DCS93_07825 [Microscillaceae bacterium]|nr:hypothetical protein [Microscillaceae bacterium]